MVERPTDSVPMTVVERIEREQAKSPDSSGAGPVRHSPRTVHQYQSGALRSESCPRHYSSIPPLILRRVAARLAYGNLKFGTDNWRKGLPMEDTINHLLDHLTMWQDAIQAGAVPAEDHMAALICNAMFLAHLEARYAADRPQTAG